MTKSYIPHTRISTTQVWVYAIALCVLLTILLWSLSAGSYTLSPAQVISILLQPQGGYNGGYDGGYDQLVIWDIRLPRIIVGTIAGALLGISGAIFQSIIRNPLASPDVIGFNAGIALGAVVALVIFGATGYGVIFGAISGGIITAILVMGLAWKTSPVTNHIPKSVYRRTLFIRLWKTANAYGFIPYRIVLIGIGCAFTITAITNFILTTTDIYRASDAMIWLIGSVGGKTWQSVEIAISGFIILLPWALYLQNSMCNLEMGNDTAISLGVHINRTRISALTLGILLSAVAISVVGPIGFVAFVSGPIARRISATAGITIGLSAIVGAIILTFADLMGRIAIPDLTLSAGIYTAIIGGPYLLWLLSQNIKRGEL